VTTTTTAEDGTQQTEQLPRTLLTLALTQDEAQKVILASKTLDVTFALLTKGSDVKDDAPETTNNDVLP
jgi:pilus assembly protein CpaB